MNSALVVISWWSNAIGLACLHHLARYTEGRTIYVVQVGKPEEQKARFRRYLPQHVQEHLYPPDLPAEHYHVIEYIAHHLLNRSEGVWFVDHDFFVHDSMTPFLSHADAVFAQSDCCLCYAPSDFAITNPLFWLSPARLPPDLPGFAPVPFPAPSEVSRRPDVFRAAPDLIQPERDTLVCVAESLAARSLARHYHLHELPRHTHLGGLYLFSVELLPESFDHWVRGCVRAFRAFYEVCPPEWVAVECPVLLERLRELEEAINDDKTT